VAVAVGSATPIAAVAHDPEPNPDLSMDSGFTIIFADAPEPPPPDDLLSTVCLHCLINDHPEAGRGLDLAREKGWAELIEGEWHA
jgi:hypothetical protein